jgi:hypothetical protein
MYDIEGFSATPNPTPDKHSDYLGEKTIFESSAILPIQFFPSRRAKPEMELERRLAFAVLANAVRCFQLNLGAQGRRKIREFAEALSWLFETTDDGPFSFDSVCYLLELHPASLRRALRQWQAMKGRGSLVPIAVAPLASESPRDAAPESSHSAQSSAHRGKRID